MFLSHLSKQFFEFVCFAQLLFTRSTFSNLKKLHFINPWFCTWFGGTGFIKKPPNDRLLLQTLISLIFCLHLNRGNTLIRRLREVRSKWLRFYNEFFFFLRSSEFVELWFVTKIVLKVHIFWEGHKILQNLHLTFVLCSASQK